MSDDGVKFYSTNAVAAMFEVQPDTVRDWINDGRLRAVKFGKLGHWRVAKEELLRFAHEDYSGKKG
jgi:excisionase family DNA binding protein